MRTYLVLLAIVVLFFVLMRPKSLWAELKRIWAQRELITRILVMLVVVYLLYGFYTIYKQDVFWWAKGG